MFLEEVKECLVKIIIFTVKVKLIWVKVHSLSECENLLSKN